MVQALVLSSLPAPKFKYSQVVKAGPNYYCSGMIAMDAETGSLINGSVGEQTQVIMENLKLLMDELDLEWQHLAMARIFSADFEHFSEINKAWETVFNNLDTPPPARSSVGVSALPLNALVEMEFTFYKM